MAISAQNVKTLREKTGAGIMDCKQALADTDGNIDKAIKLLREKGLAEAQKRSGRAAKEGIITVDFNKANDVACMVEVNCETDFVSRTDKYREFVENLAKSVLDKEIESPKELSEDIGNMIKDAISTFGENIILRKIARFKKFDKERSVIQSYIHMGGKVGVLVELLLENKNMANNDNFKEFRAQHYEMTVSLEDRSLAIPTIGNMVSREVQDFAEELRSQIIEGIVPVPIIDEW